MKQHPLVVMADAQVYIGDPLFYRKSYRQNAQFIDIKYVKNIRNGNISIKRN